MSFNTEHLINLIIVHLINKKLFEKLTGEACKF